MASHKEKLETPEIRQEAHVLLDGMQTSVTELENQIAEETDRDRKAELEAKRDTLRRALEIRKAPVQDMPDLKDAIDTIKFDDFLIEKLGEGTFDQVDLKFLMESDLMPFFDESAQGSLSIAFEQMNNSDLVSTALGRKNLTDEQLPPLLPVVRPETVDKIITTLKEARFIRAERIKDYLSSRLQAYMKLIEGAKKNKVFSAGTLQEMEADTKEAKSLLVETNNDPDLLLQVAQNIEKAAQLLEGSSEEMRDVKENRPSVEAEIRANYAAVGTFMSLLSPEGIEKARLQITAREEKPSIRKKQLEALDGLADPSNPMHEQMAELEKRLENLSDLPPEELIQVKTELEQLKKELDSLGQADSALQEALDPDNQAAALAHKTIRSIEHANSPEDLKSRLIDQLGDEHLQFVSHSDFEANYRKFTEKGHMVFYERGDEWKIIIDETAFDIETPEPVANEQDFMEQQRRDILVKKELEPLKKQLTHELLHLEFEKGKNIKDEVRRELIENRPEEWKQIRAAFLKMAEDTRKSPPHGEEWEDDDILSELYAMQNELGQFWTDGDSSTDKLNNLLVGAGLGSLIKDLAEQERPSKEESIEKIRGAQEGVEAGEEGFDPTTAAASSIKTKSRPEAIFDANQNKIEDLASRISDLRQNEHLGKVSGAASLLDDMEVFNNETADLNSMLASDPGAEVIAAAIDFRIGELSKDLGKIERSVAQAARKAPNTQIGLLRRLWINTTFMSLEDFVQVGIDVKEFLERRHKRKSADHAAKLGMALFAGTSLGREARARQQKAEAEEVNEWQSRYENLDPWELLDELDSISESKIPNPDQLKAVLRLLAKTGRIDWHNQNLWIVLNKLQSKTHLKPGDPLLLHDPVLLRQKLHIAMGEIWDYNEFNQLVRDNESSYDGEKQKYYAEHDRTQDRLTERLDELLNQYRAGERVDPVIYESLIDYCFEKGKSYAENVMFHLIAGMAEGLLTPDRGLALNGKHVNTWPPIEWFPTRQPPYTTADWYNFCQNHFEESFKAGTLSGGGLDFKNWFWTDVQNTQQVIDRTKKSVGERGWDHDWGRTIACLGDADTAERFLGGRSGQKETKVTAVANAYVGIVQWLEENAKNPMADKKDFKRMAGFIAMSEGILNGTAFNSGNKDINTRENQEMNNAKPREGGIGRHGDQTVRFHRDSAYSFLMMIDPDFFGYLQKNKDATQQEEKQRIGLELKQLLLEKYPELADDLASVQEVDQIYRNIDLIIDTMFKNMSDEYFKAMLREIAPSD